MSLLDNKVTAFTFTHSAQADLPVPAFASTAAFKAALDSQAVQLQTGLNGAIDWIASNGAPSVFINVKDLAYKASGSAQTTTGSITVGSNILTLASALDFINGQGININGNKEAASLQIIAAATVSGNVTVTLNGVAFLVAVLAGDTIAQVATKIRAAAYAGWTAGGVALSDTVTFTSSTAGVMTDAVYSAGTTTAAGTMTTLTQGSADLITSIVSGAGTTSLILAASAITTVTGNVVAHDDTAAFQNAVNYAISIGKTEITVPYGTYRYGVLTSTSGITFIGDGVAFVGTTALKLTSLAALSADVARRGVNVMAPPFNAAGNYNPATGLGTDDTAAIQAAIDSVAVYGVIILNNNYIANAVSLSVPLGKTIVFKTISPVYVNSTVTLFKRSGTLIFDHCEFYNIHATSGIFVDFLVNGTYGKVIANHCKIDGFTTAFGAVGTESNISHCEINLKQVTDSANQAWYGVLCVGNDINVSHNKFKQGRHHVYFSSGCDTCVAEGNIHVNSFWNGVEFNATTVGTTNKNIIVANSVFSGCGNDPANGRSALHVGGYFSNINIEGNTIIDFKAQGIYLEGTLASGAIDCVIQNNKIMTGIAASKGIAVRTCTNVVVKNNDVNCLNPISIESNSTYIQVTSNSIRIASGGTWWISIANTSNIDVSNNNCPDTPTWSDTYIKAGIQADVISGYYTGRGNIIAGYDVMLVYSGGPLALKKGWIANGGAIPSIFHQFGDEYKIINPAASGYFGQTCVSTGTSGAFKGYGTLQA